MKQHKIRWYRKTISYLYNTKTSFLGTASCPKPRSWKHNRTINYSWNKNSILPIGWKTGFWFSNHGNIIKI
jgi:hypothetical protein